MKVYLNLQTAALILYCIGFPNFHCVNNIPPHSSNRVSQLLYTSSLCHSSSALCDIILLSWSSFVTGWRLSQFFSSTANRGDNYRQYYEANRAIVNDAFVYVYRSCATRASQLKIWHFWAIGIERNVCRCTFNRYSVISQFAKLAAGEQLCRHCPHST